MSLWQIWCLALFIKIILLPILPISPDEAYYFAWSRHLQLSYFDHPPLISWIMLLAQPLWKTPFGVRLPGVVLGHLALIPWILILKKLGFTTRGIIFWFLCMLLGPLTGLGSFIITPDLPLIIFWGLSTLALLRAVEKPNLQRWILLGLFFGLGLLSKYTMVLFLPATVIWLFWEKKLRLLKSWQPWAGIGVSFLVFLPVVIWNFQNNFASFSFQFNHGLNENHFRWSWPLEYIGSQFGLLNPIVFVLACIAAYRFRKKQKLLICFSTFPFLFFLISSFRSHVEPNWPLCAYPSATALAICLILDEKKSAQKYSAWLQTSLVISAAFVFLVFSHSTRPWLPINKDKDHTKIMRQWIADVLVLKTYSPLYARSYQLAAYYSYYRLPEREVFKPAGLDRRDFYDFLPQPKSFAQSYIVLNSEDIMPDWFNSQYKLKQMTSLPSGLILYQIVSR